MNFIYNLASLVSESLGVVSEQTSPRMVSWNPLEDGTIKINVDGSFFCNPGLARFGDLMRNHMGEWISGFSGSCGIASNLFAELLAIFMGLNVAWKQGFHNIILEPYSQAALQLIEGDMPHHHPYAPLIFSIRSIVARDWSMNFRHSLREGNTCPEWLAKFGAKLDLVLHVWSSRPLALAHLLLADVVGIVRTHM